MLPTVTGSRNTFLHPARFAWAALLVGSATAADLPSVESLSQADLQAAFRLIREQYVLAESLDHTAVNRAALDGLLGRLAGGAELVERATTPPPDATDRPAFHSDVLAPGIAYLRLAEYSLAETEAVDEALRGFLEAKATFLILDLRVAQPAPDWAAAAKFLDRFVPPDTWLFRLQRKGQGPDSSRVFVSGKPDQRWKAGLVLLLDEETCGAGEIIAAVLLRHHPAFTVGQPTRGHTVETEDLPLNDRFALRIAVAEALLADDVSLFQTGIAPKLLVPQPLDTKHKVFASSRQGPLARHVFEQARPRFNEAALVHSTNPELEYHLARARGETTTYDTVPLTDRVLQRAVDLIVTLRETAGEP